MLFLTNTLRDNALALCRLLRRYGEPLLLAPATGQMPLDLLLLGLGRSDLLLLESEGQAWNRIE